MLVKILTVVGDEMMKYKRLEEQKLTSYMTSSLEMRDDLAV